MIESNEFIMQWDRQLKDVQAILKYLNTYPDLLQKINAENLILPENLIQSQVDWINLYEKYEGLEKEFFKPFWVPIQIDQYDYFIDISDPNYPIFNYYYKSSLPHKYTRKNLFDSINELLLLDYENVDLYMYLQMYGFAMIGS